MAVDIVPHVVDSLEEVAAAQGGATAGCLVRAPANVRGRCACATYVIQGFTCLTATWSTHMQTKGRPIGRNGIATRDVLRVQFRDGNVLNDDVAAPPTSVKPY